MKWRSAFLEMAAVLLGVLGAFAVDAWWNGRRDADRVDAYLEALAPELVSNRDAIDDSREFFVGELERVDRFLARASRSPELPGDSVLSYLGSFGPPVPISLQSSALADILGSGGLSLMTDAELRRALATYERGIRALENREAQAVRFWETQMLPYHMEHLDFRGGAIQGGIAMLPESMPAGPFLGRYYANLILARRWHTERLVNSLTVLQEAGNEVLVAMASTTGGA